jgi:uncharacterized paraquat-inducible protein A
MGNRGCDIVLREYFYVIFFPFLLARLLAHINRENLLAPFQKKNLNSERTNNLNSHDACTFGHVHSWSAWTQLIA